MLRHRRRKHADATELIIKCIVGFILLLALADGSFNRLHEPIVRIFVIITLTAVCIAGLIGIYYVILKTNWSQSPKPSTKTSKNISKAPAQAPTTLAPKPQAWTEGRILVNLAEIDWYQFEKFCSELLRAEGFTVTRKGGAKPDGGVDLITTRNQTTTLIQCKHWKTWKIKESTVRELLGSMVDFEVNKAAVFYSGEATAPAKSLAKKHGIGMVNGRALATRAVKAMSSEELIKVLQNKTHHCPKCEAPMVWRTGDFKSFWGCSNYPKCRGILRHSGPK
jgi:ribosomal protein L37AE/L43A